MRLRQMFQLGRFYRTEPAPSDGGGGAETVHIPTAAADPDDPNTVQIDDLELERITGKKPTVTDGAAEATTDEGGGAAGEGGPATEERFALLPSGEKVKLRPDGSVDPADFERAIARTHVPESVFIRETQRAKAARTAEAEETAGRTAETKPKTPEPFKRADNPVQFDDDPGGWYKHEREQDKLEMQHNMKLQQEQFDSLRQDIQQKASRDERERFLAKTEAQFDEQFNEALKDPAIGLPAADHPVRQALHDDLWMTAAADPRQAYNYPDAKEKLPDGRNALEVYVEQHGEPMSTKDLVAERWNIIKGLVEHELKLRLGKVQQAGKNTVASPHKGGGASVATATPAKAEEKPAAEGGVPPERYPKGSAWKGVLTDLSEGKRAPR